MFTTSYDSWGIVANKTLASKVAIFNTNFAGVADELVLNKKNGYVLDLDAVQWCDLIVELLSNPILLDSISQNAVSSVKEYTFENAAKGLFNASIHLNSGNL